MQEPTNHRHLWPFKGQRTPHTSLTPEGTPLLPSPAQPSNYCLFWLSHEEKLKFCSASSILERKKHMMYFRNFSVKNVCHKIIGGLKINFRNMEHQFRFHFVKWSSCQSVPEYFTTLNPSQWVAAVCRLHWGPPNKGSNPQMLTETG